MLENVIGVDAYKRDEFVVDRVCCDIVTGSQSGPMVRTINEDMTGFHEAMAKLEELPGFYRYWREVVILPPFVRNFTVLYREGHDFSERDAANPPRDQYDAECSNDVVEAPRSGKAKFWLIAAAIIAFVAAFHTVMNWLAEDGCLDRGGSWNAEKRICSARPTPGERF